MSRAVGEADLGEQGLGALARVDAGEPGRRELHLDVLERGQRRDQVELLEDEPERAQPELGEVAVAQLGEIASLEDDAAAGGPVERAEELKERRLPGAARAFESDELAGLDAQVDALERVDHERAANEGLADAAELVLAHSTVLRASAGRRRAARKAPAAPARSPPTTASPKPASRIGIPTGAESETASEVVRAACSTPKRLPAPVVELAVSVGPKSADQDGDADAEHDAEDTAEHALWRGTRPQPVARPCAASIRAP